MGVLASSQALSWPDKVWQGRRSQLDVLTRLKGALMYLQLGPAPSPSRPAPGVLRVADTHTGTAVCASVPCMHDSA